MSRADFMRQITRHHEKLDTVLRLKDHLDTLTAVLGGYQTASQQLAPDEYDVDLRAQVASQNVRKLRGLYVDLSEADEVNTPDAITAAETEDLLELVEVVADVAETFFLDREP